MRYETSRRGNYVAGEEHPHHVLTWDQVKSIRQEYNVEDATQRPSQKALSRKYGVSSVTIHKIIHNTYWPDPDYVPRTHYT